jgi:hypothetical protein
MKTPVVALVALAVVAGPAWAEEHLVRPEAAQQQLLDAGAARTRDLAAVESFVASPEGSAALAGLGVDSTAVRRALPRLSDAELGDLAARAAALQADPVAGALSRTTIYIGAIALAAIIIIILIA